MSLLDIANTIQLEDAATKANNREIIASLNDYAEELGERFGVKVQSFERFDRENPNPEQARGFWSRLAKWSAVAAIAGGAILAGGVVLAAVANVTISGNVGLVVTKLAVLLGGGAVTAALFDDERPDLDQKQVARYENFLNETTEKLELAVSQGVIQEKTQQANMTIDQQIAMLSDKGPTHFQDMVAQSRAVAQMQGQYVT